MENQEWSAPPRLNFRSSAIGCCTRVASATEPSQKEGAEPGSAPSNVLKPREYARGRLSACVSSRPDLSRALGAAAAAAAEAAEAGTAPLQAPLSRPGRPSSPAAEAAAAGAAAAAEAEAEAEAERS